MDTTTQILEGSLRLILEGNLVEAQKLLAQILKNDSRNEEAWRLLSYAVTAPDQKAYILRKLLLLNPQDHEARLRLAELSRSPDEIAQLDLPAEVIPDKYAAFSSGFNFVDRLKLRLTLLWRRLVINWGHFKESRLALFGLMLIGIFAIMAVSHPILMNTVWPKPIYDPITGFDMQVAPHPAPPSSRHIFGTDTLGRDVLSRLLAATTPTFKIGITAAITAAIVGTLFSTIAAYYQNRVDMFITNLADVFLLLPAPMIMVIVGGRFRDIGPFLLGLVYGVVSGAGGTTLVMRAQAIQIASKPFMDAAKISGGGSWHIISRHLIPSILPLAALQMMITITGVVVADGFISFFGITRTVNNWGTLIYDAFVYGSFWGGISWNILIPAASCFSLFALGFFLVSRGLHRVANPDLRSER
jgi:peptide/nickel transport system permease protein